MAEPGKRSSSATTVGRSQIDRAKSLDDIISQQARLLDRLSPEDARYQRIREITNRYADNIFSTPESISDRGEIEAIARSSDRSSEENGRSIGALNRAMYGRKYPRSTYMRNR